MPSPAHSQPGPATPREQSLFRVRNIVPFGVEVEVDLRRPLTPDEQAELQYLRLTQHLLLFRGQSLSMDDQERVMGYLGPVLTDKMDRIDYISNTRKDGDLGEGVILFHSDLSFTPEPFQAISLYGVDVEQAPSTTSFASGARAYRMLPRELQDLLEECHTLHSLAVDNAKRVRDRELPPYNPRAVHQAVLPHPISGEPILYVCEQQIDKIFGFTEEESEKLLETLFSYLYAPHNVYHHHWRNGDLLLWDNIALQHGRLQAPAGPRTLQRVTGAEKGLLLMYPYMQKNWPERVARYTKPRDQWVYTSTG